MEARVAERRVGPLPSAGAKVSLAQFDQQFVHAARPRISPGQARHFLVIARSANLGDQTLDGLVLRAAQGGKVPDRQVSQRLVGRLPERHVVAVALPQQRPGPRAGVENLLQDAHAGRGLGQQHRVALQGLPARVQFKVSPEAADFTAGHAGGIVKGAGVFGAGIGGGRRPVMPHADQQVAHRLVGGSQPTRQPSHVRPKARERVVVKRHVAEQQADQMLQGRGHHRVGVGDHAGLVQRQDLPQGRPPHVHRRMLDAGIERRVEHLLVGRGDHVVPVGKPAGQRVKIICPPPGTAELLIRIGDRHVGLDVPVLRRREVLDHGLAKLDASQQRDGSARAAESGIFVDFRDPVGFRVRCKGLLPVALPDDVDLRPLRWNRIHRQRRNDFSRRRRRRPGPRRRQRHRHDRTGHHAPHRRADDPCKSPGRPEAALQAGSSGVHLSGRPAQLNAAAGLVSDSDRIASRVRLFEGEAAGVQHRARLPGLN